MKLQKLLYFVYRDYYKKFKEPLFPDRFAQWKYGPVVVSVYYNFQSYGARDIDKYSKVGESICKVDEKTTPTSGKFSKLFGKTINTIPE